MDVDINHAVGWVAALLWPLIRIAGALMTAPVFSSVTIPVRVRVGVAVIVTLAVVAVLPPMPKVAPLSLEGLAITVQQLVIGIAMGFVVRLVFEGIALGGQLIALSMGLSFASLVEPQSGTSMPVLSQFYILLATLLFLIANGHLVMLRLLIASFEMLPVSSGGLDRGHLWLLVQWGGEVFIGGLELAMPAMIAMLIVNLGFGVMSRAAPTLNLFAVGFPLALALGFLVVWLSLRDLAPTLSALSNDAFTLLPRLLTGNR